MGHAEKNDRPDNYDINVFINCPFDDEYISLLEAIVFTVLYFGFLPRSAKESRDGKESRINKIKKIISECRFGVHDLSRIELSKGLYPRFNMPFELGLDIGCAEFGADYFSEKSILILDRRKYRFRAFLSDISGQDPSIYGGSVRGIIREVRDWLHPHIQSPPGAETIYRDYIRFRRAEPKLRSRLKKDAMGTLSFLDYLEVVRLWLRENG